MIGSRDSEDAGGVLTGIASIVLVGGLLGVGFNWVGLASRPVWGLPWIGENRVASMPTLEELTPEERKPEPGGGPVGGYGQSSDPMAVGTAGGAQGLPEIPDLDRPIEIQLAAIKQLFDAGAAVLVDAREPDEYAAGHIPGALSMPFDEVTAEPEKLENLETGGRPIVTYCGGGACELSLSLAWELIYAGQTKVTVYMGGFPEWVEAGYPVATGPALPGEGA
jgi:rhodanese-related sulfurtransferase